MHKMPLSLESTFKGDSREKYKFKKNRVFGNSATNS